MDRVALRERFDMNRTKVDLSLVIREVAQQLNQFSFPDLKRPRVPADAPATPELVDWGIRVYCFSWMRHLCTLVQGAVTLVDSRNNQSARILARSIFELGAHAYYVNKHLQQHIRDAKWSAAWDFLTPITMGSRYMNEQIPEESALFPAPAHIRKVINCFSEVTSRSAQDDYSYLSEFSHPNVLAFMQYYNFCDPETITFVDHKPLEGFLGATTVAVIQGLLSIQRLLVIAHERDVSRSLVGLLQEVLDKAEAAGAATG